MLRHSLQIIVLPVVLVGLSACIERREVAQPVSDLDRLTGWMSGSFSSQNQAAADSNYFDIRLEMVQIWPERTDGYWLYVEQAAATQLDQPYRQRIYHLAEVDDSTLSSSIFEFDDPMRMAGKWRVPQDFSALTPASLTARTGCTIALHRRSDSLFVGSTVAEECLSNYRGASYATTKVEIGPTHLYSWDRGWDSTGAQVWGAVDGGYVFHKLAEE